VETCGGGKRDAIEVVTTNAPARGLAAGAGGIIYFAMSGGKFAGYLADYEVRTHPAGEAALRAFCRGRHIT